MIDKINQIGILEIAPSFWSYGSGEVQVTRPDNKLSGDKTGCGI
jgi:hypothetical protein